MSNRKKKREMREQGLPYFWGSASMNQAAYFMYLDWLMSIAMSRFKWINLPKTCDQRYLEYILMTQGMATIAHPKDSDQFFSTMAVTKSVPNVYDNPTLWESFGNSGWNFSVNPSNGVIVYDNFLRRPIMPSLEYFAYELADIKRTKQINRMQQKTPYIITAPQEKKNDMVNMFKQISGGEPAIIGTDSLSDININAIQTGVQFMGEELNADTLNVWNEALTFLGIKNLSRKTERMIQDEVLANNEPTTMRFNDPLTCRRTAADKLNDRFGLNIQVVKNIDNESDNYAFITSIPRQENADGDDQS